MDRTAPIIDDESPQFRAGSDERLLGVTALVPGLLLVLGLAGVLTGTDSTATLALLAGHFVAQFIVLLVYVSLLMNDEGLDRVGRAMWAVAFVVAAPVALPVYYWVRVRAGKTPESRVEVREV